MADPDVRDLIAKMLFEDMDRYDYGLSHWQWYADVLVDALAESGLAVLPARDVRLLVEHDDTDNPALRALGVVNRVEAKLRLRARLLALPAPGSEPGSRRADRSQTDPLLEAEERIDGLYDGREGPGDG
jgi:hypothetical protein